jgi:hypothetical protein
MKKLLIALTTVTLTAACYGQGQVVFANKVGTAVDAPVLIFGTQTGPGPDYSAQLFLSSGGSLTPLTPATTFRAAGTGAAAIADRYWINQDVIVLGVASGANATFVVRAWRTVAGSYDDSILLGRGESAPFTVAVGGGQLPPANLTTLQGFQVGILPEPGTIALGVLGAVALALCRRRQRAG